MRDLMRILQKSAIWCGNCQKVRFSAEIAKKCDISLTALKAGLCSAIWFSSTQILDPWQLQSTDSDTNEITNNI